MKKRVCCLMLALFLLASSVLSGCGSDPAAVLESLKEKAESVIQEGGSAAGDALNELIAEASKAAEGITETLEEAAEELTDETGEADTAEAETEETERVTLSHGDSWKVTEEAAEGEETEAPEEGEETPAEETEAPLDETEETVSEEAADEEEIAAFHAFTDGLIADFFEGDTFDAHYYFMHPEDFGISMEEASLPQFSYDEAYDSSYEDFLNESLETLSTFDYEKLDRAARITYDVVKDYLETELTGTAFDFYYEPLCGTSGYQSSLPVMFAEYKFFTTEDVELYLSYLDQMPAHFEDLLLYEQQKAEAGLFMEDALAEEVIEQIESFLETESDTQNFLYVSFEDRVAALALTEEETQAYIDRNQELVPKFYEAYRILRDGMQELLGSNQYKGGLCNYPDGDAYYAYLVKSHVGTSMTPEELWDYLEEKETEAVNELTVIYMQNPSVATKMDSFTYPSTDPEEIMPMLIEAANEKFPELPEVQYEIHYVDASLREFLNPAFYIVPPFGEGAKNEIYINPDEDGNVADDIWVTLSHEGYPGHLYQYNFWKNVNEYAVRGLMDPTGYAEGWAQYVEHQSYYFEGADKDTADFIRANDLATMAIYGLMDLGIHYQGWTIMELRDFLTENFGELDEETVTDLYNYLVGNPAEYLQYAVGELEMSDIVDTYTEEGDVDMKEFYREYLTIGPAPFDIVRKYLGLE